MIPMIEAFLTPQGLTHSALPAVMYFRHPMKAALVRTPTSCSVALTNMTIQAIAEEHPIIFQAGNYTGSNKFKREFEKYARELDRVVDGPDNENAIFTNLKKLPESNSFREIHFNAMLKAAESFQAELGKQLKKDVEKLLGSKKEGEGKVEQAEAGSEVSQRSRSPRTKHKSPRRTQAKRRRKGKAHICTIAQSESKQTPISLENGSEVFHIYASAIFCKV